MDDFVEATRVDSVDTFEQWKKLRDWSIRCRTNCKYSREEGGPGWSDYDHCEVLNESLIYLYFNGAGDVCSTCAHFEPKTNDQLHRIFEEYIRHKERKLLECYGGYTSKVHEQFMANKALFEEHDN